MSQSTLSGRTKIDSSNTPIPASTNSRSTRSSNPAIVRNAESASGVESCARCNTNEKLIAAHAVKTAASGERNETNQANTTTPKATYATLEILTEARTGFI